MPTGDFEVVILGKFWNECTYSIPRYTFSLFQLFQMDYTSISQMGTYSYTLFKLCLIKLISLFGQRNIIDRCVSLDDPHRSFAYVSF